MGKVIGIDLGTTNSVACYIEHGEPRVIVNEEGARLTPSIVGFSKDGERLVGEIAKRQLLMYPEQTIHSIKRLIGRGTSKPAHVTLSSRRYASTSSSLIVRAHECVMNGFEFRYN